MTHWYSFEEVHHILAKKNLVSDPDFVKIARRITSMPPPTTESMHDMFLRSGIELVESKYMIICFHTMFTSSNPVLRHGVRIATEIVLSLLERGANIQ